MGVRDDDSYRKCAGCGNRAFEPKSCPDCKYGFYCEDCRAPQQCPVCEETPCLEHTDDHAHPEEPEETIGVEGHEHTAECRYLASGLWDCGITDQH